MTGNIQGLGVKYSWFIRHEKDNYAKKFRISKKETLVVASAPTSLGTTKDRTTSFLLFLSFLDCVIPSSSSLVLVSNAWCVENSHKKGQDANRHARSE